jgi:hypothetical protein
MQDSSRNAYRFGQYRRGCRPSALDVSPIRWMTARAPAVTSDHQWIALGRTGTAAAVLKRTCFSVMSTGTGDTAAGAGFASNSSCGLLMGAVRQRCDWVSTGPYPGDLPGPASVP